MPRDAVSNGPNDVNSQASTSGNVGVMNLLLKKGADVAVTDKDGVTTLMSAASHGHAQVRCYTAQLRMHYVCRILLHLGDEVFIFYMS